MNDAGYDQTLNGKKNFLDDVSDDGPQHDIDQYSLERHVMKIGDCMETSFKRVSTPTDQRALSGTRRLRGQI